MTGIPQDKESLDIFTAEHDPKEARQSRLPPKQRIFANATIAIKPPTRTQSVAESANTIVNTIEKDLDEMMVVREEFKKRHPNLHKENTSQRPANSTGLIDRL